MKVDYFAKRSDVISIAVVGSHLLAVLSPIYLVAALGPAWHTPILLLIFGLSMNGVLNLMHECAHILVFKRRDWSDVLGRWIVGPLVFADFDGYRERIGRTTNSSVRTAIRKTHTSSISAGSGS